MEAGASLYLYIRSIFIQKLWPLIRFVLMVRGPLSGNSKTLPDDLLVTAGRLRPPDAARGGRTR